MRVEIDDRAWMPGYRASSGWRFVLLFVGCAISLSACQTVDGAERGAAPGARYGHPEPAPMPADRFSGERAWSHLVALEGIGPRVAGTKGAARARAYVRDQLEAIGVDLRLRRTKREPVSANDAGPDEFMHITAVLPGGSSDVLLLAAPLDTPRLESFDFLGTNESASAAAVLLELTRALAASEPRPYTIWMTWIDGDHLEVEGPPSTSPSLAGSRSLVHALAQSDELSKIRLAVFFGAVGDADLQIARDLRSNTLYREVFWDAAADLGHAKAFPRDRGYGAATTGQSAFIEADVGSVVAIADAQFGDEVDDDEGGRGSYWHSPEDNARNCSPASLDAVGAVALEGLDRVAARLQKIDAFVSAPLRVGLEASVTGRLSSERGPAAGTFPNDRAR